MLYTGVGINLPDSHPAYPGYLTDETVSFEGGPIRQTNNLISGANGNDFIDIAGTIISETWKHTIASGVGADTEIYAYRQVNDPVPGFPHFGGEVIAKVPGLAASNAVYFGEWAPWDGSTGTAHDPDLGMSSSLRTVYYVGENPTTSMPNLTNVAYDVVGIQKYKPGYSGRCLHRYPDRQLQRHQRFHHRYPERRQLQWYQHQQRWQLLQRQHHHRQVLRQQCRGAGRHV